MRMQAPLRLALVLFVALLGAVRAQPRHYNSDPPEASGAPGGAAGVVAGPSEASEHRRELGWQRFYSRTHSDEEEYDTTYAWRGTGPGMSRGPNAKMTETFETVELPGGRGAWSGGDVRLDRTNHKWGDYVLANCTDPNGAGVETLASGVQYIVAGNGTGAGTEHPKDDSPCKVHYEARKGINGTVRNKDCVPVSAIAFRGIGSPPRCFSESRCVYPRIRIPAHATTRPISRYDLHLLRASLARADIRLDICKRLGPGAGHAGTGPGSMARGAATDGRGRQVGDIRAARADHRPLQRLVWLRCLLPFHAGADRDRRRARRRLQPPAAQPESTTPVAATP